MKKKTKQIAPRLANGRCRERVYNALPPEIKMGIRAIARMENKSISWTLEEVIVRYFKLRTHRHGPEYIDTTRSLQLVRKRA